MWEKEKREWRYHLRKWAFYMLQLQTSRRLHQREHADQVSDLRKTNQVIQPKGKKMGLFDGMKTKMSPTFDPQKAIMTIVIAAIKVDGNVSDEEIGYLRSMCARSPIFANNTKDEDDSVIDFASNVTEQLAMDGVKRAAESLTEELRQTAFAFATEMVLADGMVGDQEEAFITDLAEMLGVDGDMARSVIEVTLIRARSV